MWCRPSCRKLVTQAHNPYLFQLQEVESQNLDRLHHQAVQLRIWDVEWFFLTNLLCKHLNVLVEGFGGTDVTGDTGFPWRASGQFALLENESQQREQRMPVNGILVPLAVSGVGHAAHAMVGHDVVALIVVQAGAMVHVAHGPRHGVVGLHGRRVMSGQAVVVALSCHGRVDGEGATH